MKLGGTTCKNKIYCLFCWVQVQENIFSESNKLIKSIQIILEALNELRLCRVMERTALSSMSSKRESSKVSWLHHLTIILDIALWPNPSRNQLSQVTNIHDTMLSEFMRFLNVCGCGIYPLKYDPSFLQQGRGRVILFFFGFFA